MTKASMSPWGALLNACLKKRIPVERFEVFAENLVERNIKPQPFECMKTIIDTQQTSVSGVDPLAPLYVECMLRHSWVEESELLQALFENFQGRMGDPHKNLSASPGITSDTKFVSLQLEEILFALAVNAFASGMKPTTSKEANTTIKIAISWITALVEADRVMLLNSESLTQQVFMTRVALGTLMVALLGNQKIREILDPSSGVDISKQLKEPLTAFIPLVNQISPQVSHRIEYLVHDLFPTNQVSQGLGLSVGDLGLGGVIDGSAVQSRASVFVYLESLFHGWPSLDDQTVLTYLHARYKGDIDSSISDLITASFDLNSVAINRGASPHDTRMYQLFLTERLPQLILTLTTETYVPFDITFLLPGLLQRLTTTNVLREEFLFACTLHGLLSEENIENILGSKPSLALPKGGKAIRENLIQEYRKDSTRAEYFVSRVGIRDGNSGTYAEVLMEVLNYLCAQRDTMSLRSLCNVIACNSNVIDTMALFSTPARFLGPIWRLLDGWGHEEDQGEYQPVYDEYGACFLLVTTCINRFGLKAADLDGLSSTGLVACMLDMHGSAPSMINILSQDQQRHFAGWVRALFETEGISDELMSTCPPQDFYKIVPTIFNQSVIACRSDALDMEKIKNGLELLLEPFLLPSIILGIRALIIQAWVQPTDAGIILRILRELIMPSGDRSPTHEVVLSIVARDLERTLQDLRHRNAQLEDIGPLLERLQPIVQTTRATTRPLTIGAIALDYPLPTANPASSVTILPSLFQDLQSLFSWTFNPASPPTYSYARLHATLSHSGGPRVLAAIIDQLKSCAQSPVLADVSIDIATTLICMPDKRNCATVAGASRSALSRLTLYDSLQLEAQEGASKPPGLAPDSLRAELVAKLANRAAAYPINVALLDMNVAPLPNLLDGALDLVDSSSVDLSGAGGAGVATSASAQSQTVLADAMPAQVDVVGLGFPIEDNSFHLDIDAALAGGDAGMGQEYVDVPQSADDDIFAGLAFDEGMDFS